MYLIRIAGKQICMAQALLLQLSKGCLGISNLSMKRLDQPHMLQASTGDL
jgi:hypothetical protein